jgi:hypothetical protein
VASLTGIDESHSTVAAVDAGFKHARRGSMLHNRHQHKNNNDKKSAGKASPTHKSNVHKGLLLSGWPPTQVLGTRGCAQFSDAETSCQDFPARSRPVRIVCKNLTRMFLSGLRMAQ